VSNQPHADTSTRRKAAGSSEDWVTRLIVGLPVCIVLVALAFATVSHVTSTPHQVFHDSGNVGESDSGRSQSTLGDPAITPHLNLNADAGGANLPTFTAADATAYAKANRPEGMLSLASIAVVSVQFMTDAQADQLLNTVVGLAPNALVCVVKVTGRFQALLLGAAPTNVPTFNAAYEIFDGRTGNYLESAQA
jgi:hypothetical protein